MIEAMRELALLTLQVSLKTTGTMAEIRTQHRKELRPWLVEENEKTDRVNLSYGANAFRVANKQTVFVRHIHSA